MDIFELGTNMNVMKCGNDLGAELVCFVLSHVHILLLQEYGGDEILANAQVEETHFTHARLRVPAADGDHCVLLVDVDETGCLEEAADLMRNADVPPVDVGEWAINEFINLVEGVVCKDVSVFVEDDRKHVVGLVPASGFQVSEYTAQYRCLFSVNAWGRLTRKYCAPASSGHEWSGEQFLCE